MTINELISGNIYVSGSKEPYIFRSNGNNGYRTRLAMYAEDSGKYAENSTFGKVLEKDLRLPTQEEILQLEACERAGKYQEIKIIHYEIY